jgi:hypothetical protein
MLGINSGGNMLDRINQIVKLVAPVYGLVAALLYGILYLAYSQ